VGVRLVTEPIEIDLDENTDLARLAEEVRVTNTPRLLRWAGEPVTVISPIPKRRGRLPPKAVTDADRKAFLDAFGGWKDVDTDRILANIYEHREMSLPLLPRTELQ